MNNPELEKQRLLELLTQIATLLLVRYPDVEDDILDALQFAEITVKENAPVQRGLHLVQ